jgi:hypothetical protein
MIDLNLKRKKQDEEPLGMIILALMPFVALFWVLIEAGL